MRERFVLDQQRNILFINFAGLKIESRVQVDEMEQCVRALYEKQGRRMYAIVNYEGTEIAPEIIDYYGERIKELYDYYGIATVRYSSNGFTRSMLRYLGAAKDLESNIFATQEEAIRAIQEIENKLESEKQRTKWSLLDPRHSLLGKLILGWAAIFLVWGIAVVLIPAWAIGITSALLLGNAIFTSAFLYRKVLQPVQQIEMMAQQLVTSSHYDPVQFSSQDEIGKLGWAWNETAEQLRHDIERLSGLYHISLLIGAGTNVSQICELLTRKIARLLGAEMCLILFYDEREQQLYAQTPGLGLSDEKLALLRTGIDEKSIVAFVLKTGEPYLTNDAANDPHISRAAAALLGVREMLAVPLQTGERKLGTLAVMNKRGGFQEKDRQLVTIFASQASQLLINAQLFEQVILSERLAAVGELVAGVAHEVRNPLFGITTTLSALSRKLADRELAKPFLDVVNSEVDHLNHLMEQLLEHSRPLRFESTASDLREVIHEAIAEIQPQAEVKGVALVCDCAAALPGLHFDRRKMHGVFANLLDNAVQHTEANGEVRIVVAVASNTKGNLQIEVRDTGIGIVPEHLSRIFEPFFTTRPKGTGLGLAITQKTIHEHGGTILVHSEVGKGSSFVISLPLIFSAPKPLGR